jgi:hypothetical protein
VDVSSKLIVLASLALVSCTGGLGGETDPGSGDVVGEPGGPGTGGGDHTGNDNALGCPSVLAEVRSLTPTVVLLVDRSGTMNNDFGSTDRWDAVYQTLMDPMTGVVANYQSEVNFGLALYSGQDDNPTCPIISQVAPAANNFNAINSQYAPLNPIEDTPTAESLNVISPQLAALDSPGPKAIVLATDGLPDTCADPDPDGQPEARAMAVAAARSAYERGIETYIISVGDEVADDHLQEMANAGVGLAADDPGAAPFWRALSPIQLEAAFDGIVAGVQGCDYQLDGAVPDGGTGEVTLDGGTLAQGSEWELIGNNTIRLLGSACELIRDGGEHTVEAIFTCTGDGNHPGTPGTPGADPDPDNPGPGECEIDDDCDGDDVCNNGTCEPPSGPSFPPVD